jgi:hypothetical protein
VTVASVLVIAQSEPDDVYEGDDEDEGGEEVPEFDWILFGV